MDSDVDVVQELAVLAGFFDADGNISIKYWTPAGRAGRVAPETSLNLHVGQTSTEILEKFKQAFGGFIRQTTAQNPRAKPAWMWTTSGIRAMRALQEFLPFLTVKHERAEVAIDYQRLRIAQPKPRYVDWEAVGMRAAYWQEMKRLNRKGVDA